MLVDIGMIKVKFPLFHTTSPGNLPRKGSLFIKIIPIPTRIKKQPTRIIVLASES
jgi:hypothetical protein